MEDPEYDGYNMKKRYFLSILILSLVLGSYSQEYIPNHTGDYLGLTPPEDSAIIFAPEIVSVTNRGEYAFSISPDHDEYFYNAGVSADTTQPYGLLQIKRVGDMWLKPQKANLNQEGFWEQEAFFSPDGNDIYYAVSDSGYTKIWLSHKTKSGWSRGERLNSPINDSSKRVFYATFSNNGNLYYTNVDKLKIHMSEPNNGEYDSFNEIGLPRAGHAYIAPDEDFILFDSRQSDGYGKTDIYIAFKTVSGIWSEPINLGPQINTEYLETCPSLSQDGKYIFFGRYNEVDEKSNIYWISSGIIEELREKVSVELHGLISEELENIVTAFLKSWEPPFDPEGAIALFSQSSDFNLVIDGFEIGSYEEWARNVPNFMSDDDYFFTSYSHEIRDIKTVVLSPNSGVVTISYIWDSVSTEGIHERTPGAATLTCRLEENGWRIVHYHGSHGEAKVVDEAMD